LGALNNNGGGNGSNQENENLSNSYRSQTNGGNRNSLAIFGAQNRHGGTMRKKSNQ
jgi:hypothetical protein